MHCPNCSTENADDSLFCMQCGSRLVTGSDSGSPAGAVAAAPTTDAPAPPPPVDPGTVVLPPPPVASGVADPSTLLPPPPGDPVTTLLPPPPVISEVPGPSPVAPPTVPEAAQTPVPPPVDAVVVEPPFVAAVTADQVDPIGSASSEPLDPEAAVAEAAQEPETANPWLPRESIPGDTTATDEAEPVVADEPPVPEGASVPGAPDPAVVPATEHFDPGTAIDPVAVQPVVEAPAMDSDAVVEAPVIDSGAVVEAPPEPWEPDPGPADPHDFAAHLARMSDATRPHAEAPLLVASSLVEPDETVLVVVPGLIGDIVGVAMVTDRRVLLVNGRRWNPVVEAFPIDVSLSVEGWQDEQTAMLTFIADRLVRITAIVDKPLAFEVARVVRERVAASTGTA
ncbi:MAG: zinc-ribbon domain-containing protein [Actinobacteria bacterium]|nr:zinc-ribbon domain-containing protein [Actinomycetota bacterium]